MSESAVQWFGRSACRVRCCVRVVIHVCAVGLEVTQTWRQLRASVAESECPPRRERGEGEVGSGGPGWDGGVALGAVGEAVTMMGSGGVGAVQLPPPEGRSLEGLQAPSGRGGSAPSSWLQGPVWIAVREMVASQPRLGGLEERLRDLVKGARAPATVRKYDGCVSRLVSFVELDLGEVFVLPVPPSVLALWLVSLQVKGLAPGTIEGALAAVAWVHRAAGVPDSSTDAVVRLALDGAKRANAGPVKRKQAFLPEEIVAMIRHLRAVGSLRALRTATMLALAFAALLRLDELRALRIKDVVVQPDRLTLSIAKSKTDISKGGAD